MRAATTLRPAGRVLELRVLPWGYSGWYGMGSVHLKSGKGKNKALVPRGSG